MAWSKLVDMELDDEDQLDLAVAAIPEKPRYPYGLRICLTEKELEKLGLEADCEIGDMIDLRAFAVVTSCSVNQTEHGSECRVELQIRQMKVENESTEDQDTEG